MLNWNFFRLRASYSGVHSKKKKPSSVGKTAPGEHHPKDDRLITNVILKHLFYEVIAYKGKAGF